MPTAWSGCGNSGVSWTGVGFGGNSDTKSGNDVKDDVRNEGSSRGSAGGSEVSEKVELANPHQETPEGESVLQQDNL